MTTRTLAIALLILATSAVACGKKKKDKSDVPEVTSAEAPAGHTPSFGPSPDGLYRRFSPPAGEELLALGGSPDGTAFVTVSGRKAYVFDDKKESGVAIPLGGFVPEPVVIVTSKRRAFVLTRGPEGKKEGRLRILDLEGHKVFAESGLPGRPAFGIPLEADQLAIVLEEPAGILVYDGTGGLIARGDGPAGPRRGEAAPDGTWAVVAGEGGVVTVSVARGEPKPVAPLATGPTAFAAAAALPFGDSVLVVGRNAAGHPAAIVVPRQGGNPTTVDVGAISGSGSILGAARSADGTRALVFVDTGRPEAPRMTLIYDTASWAKLGSIADGPVLEVARAVANGGRVVVPGCEEILELDLAKLEATTLRRIPSGSQGICLDGLYRSGSQLVARQGGRLISHFLQ